MLDPRARATKFHYDGHAVQRKSGTDILYWTYCRTVVRIGALFVFAGLLGGILEAVPKQGRTPAQHPFPSLDQYVRHVWQTDDGLPENSVRSIAQTSDGYLWFGTEAGLARFDGFQFVVFDKSNTPLLASSNISALLVDRDQTLWIGTQAGGLTCYRDGHFASPPWRSRFAAETILSMHQDRAGALWIGTEGSGLFRLYRGEIRHYGLAEGLPANSVFSIASDLNNDLWLGTQRGLARLSQGETRISGIALGSGREDVRALWIDAGNKVWAGTRDGLFSRAANDSGAFVPVSALKGHAISVIVEDRSHLLWVGTLDNGLRRLVAGQVTDFEKSGGVWSLLQDRSGTVWAGTTEGGLISFRQGAFTALTTTQGLASNVSLGIYQDHTGAMWIGSEGGLSKWTPGGVTKFTTDSGLPNNFVFSVTQDGGGTIWAGTRKGLARLQNGKFRRYDHDGLPLDSPILATFTDLDGSLWIGFRGGAAHLQGSQWTALNNVKGMSDRVVTVITRDKQKRLWVGTDGGGLFEIREARSPAVQRFTTQDGLPANVIYALLPDDDGSLWIGTNSGLSHLSSGGFQNLPKSAGLIDDAVFQALDDGAGNLWLSSNRGIQRIRKLDASHYFTSLNHSAVPSQTFNLSDGMKSRECNGGFQPAGWRASDGRLWFPTLSGVVFVNPHESPAPRFSFAPILESVLVGDRSLSQLGTIIIPPGKKQVEFRFTAPGASSPEKLTFSYQLEGFDHDWVSAGVRHVGYYTNLPPGHFNFRIRACVYDSCVENRSVLTVVVEPVFYQTTWFIALAALSLCGMGFGLHQARIRQLRQSELKLLRVVDERTHELREARNHLEVRVNERTHELAVANHILEAEVEFRKAAEIKATAASRAKSEFLNNMSHEIRTPINGIMGMTDLALCSEPEEEQKEYLEIIKISADSLLRIVNDILDFSKIEARKLELESIPFRPAEIAEQLRRLISVRAAQKNLSFYLSLAPDIPDEVIGDPGRLRQTLLNLLENALKFTPQGSVSLAISRISLQAGLCLLRFAVTDTGIGIPENKQSSIFNAFSQADNSSTRIYGGTGLGLAICSQLVQLMNGDIQVESSEGAGSTFAFTAKFSLPVHSGVGDPLELIR